jgi:putative addiction module killer protein
MIELIKSDAFDEWLENLRDERAKARIIARLERLERLERLAAGNQGDVKPVGDGVSELRINYGPGYRVYYMQHGAELIVLLCGGDKSTQDKDIRKAKEIASDWRDSNG